MIMPYGKYRGWTPQQVLDTDRQYLTWFVRNCKADPTLLSTIGRLLHQKTPHRTNAKAPISPWKARNPSEGAKSTSVEAGPLGGQTDDFEVNQ